MNNEIKNKTNVQFNDADWPSVLNDTCKELSDHITFDTDWFFNELKSVYYAGFKEGFLTAKDINRDEFGNFIYPED